MTIGFPHRRPFTPLCLLAACMLPTDRGSDLRVEVDNVETQLIVGELSAIGPRLVDPAGIEIAGARFFYRSTDDAVITSNSDGIVLAVSSGRAGIIVEALGFEGAIPDTAFFRVIDNVQIDFVSPTTVRFGDIVTVVGTALDPTAASLISIGASPAPVLSFTPSVAGDATSRDTLRIFVPAAAAARSDVVVLRQSGGSANVPIVVEQFDLYEPNDETPARIRDVLALANPQLAFERSGPAPYDWYRFGSTSGTFTIEIRPRFSTQKGIGQMTVHSPTTNRGDPASWSVSAQADEVMCRGLVAKLRPHFVIVDFDVTNEPVFFPFMDITLDSFDLAVEMFSAPFDNNAYEVLVHPRYRSDFAPDAFEENDFCDLAPLVADGFQATLSLDHAYDVDWFRLTLDADSRIQARVDCRSCPSFGEGAFDELADIDILLFEDTQKGLPTAPLELPTVGIAAQFRAEFEHLDVTVPAGNYFLLIQNAFFTAVRELELSLSVSATADPATTSKEGW